jgi:uncharacterized damage-inducible protein DinB
MVDLRYPIGNFDWSLQVGPDRLRQALSEIEHAPLDLRKAVEGLDTRQLETPYRPEGWTIRQVVHHLPDSHLNSYVRFKLALTEEKPAVHPYYENLWAELEDGRNGPIEISLNLLETLHKRWMLFLRSLSDVDFKKSFIHPDLGEVSLDRNLCYYAWHGRHHTAQITSLRERMGW